MPSVSGRICVAAVGHFMQEGLEPNGVARANGGLHRRSCTSPERALSAPCVRPRLRCGDQFGVRVPSRGSLRHGGPSVGLLDARGSCPTDQRIGGPGGVLSIRRRGEDVSEQAPSLLNSLDGRLRRSVVSPRSPTLWVHRLMAELGLDAAVEARKVRPPEGHTTRFTAPELARRCRQSRAGLSYRGRMVRS